MTREVIQQLLFHAILWMCV